MILLLLFSFLSGMGTILAPCIWPVLPIVLSSSLAGRDHWRPLGITLGVMLSFAFFTLTISTLVRVFHLDPNILRVFAVIVISFLGFMMLIPSLGAWVDVMISRLSNAFGGKTVAGNGFLPGFVTGLSLGIVWSPCAGPILATIATLAAIGKVNVDVVLVTIAYVIGVGLPLFAFAYGGQRFVAKARGLSKYTGIIQRVFGVLMILTALAILTNYDQKFQLAVLNRFPALGTAINGFENSQVVTKQLAKLKGTTAPQSGTSSDLLNANLPAPDFVGINKWLNPEKAISITDLKGKVVLVDFWTYTCINCIRTLPHVTSWYDKYKDQGFVVIGIHTPEFAFEHDTNNVLHAISMYNIHYPVAQDNDYATWNNYNNQYWPAEYLIDKNGVIRRTHFGEGEYDQMEQAIQLLLKDAGHKVTAKIDTMPDTTPKTQLSPETYVGADRMQYYDPSGNTGVTKRYFVLAGDPHLNAFNLGGNWDIQSGNAVTGESAVLNYNFYADKVYLVLRPGTNKNPTVKVFIDNKPADSTNAGADVVNGVVTIDSDRLYNLIDLKGHPGAHLLRFEFQNSGTEVFAFTFG